MPFSYAGWPPYKLSETAYELHEAYRSQVELARPADSPSEDTKKQTKRTVGRPPKAKPDVWDAVIKSMIDSGDVEKYGPKALLRKYDAMLPKRISDNALRMRIWRARNPNKK
jgi:hypothetical protein